MAVYRHKKLNLNDGRVITYLDLGDKTGTPVLFFHGWPGSSLSAIPIKNYADKFGLRIIAPDRPGYGGSTFYKNRKIGDYANDMKELTRHLKLDKFYVIGLSGGTPFALACAYYLPSNVIETTIISGVTEVAKYNGPENLKIKALRSRRISIEFLSKLKEQVDHLPKKVELLLKNVTNIWDYNFLLEAKYMKNFVDGLKRSLSQGVEAALQDRDLYEKGWGFNIGEISGEVTIWHGTDDKIAPLKFGQNLHERIPNSEFYTVEGRGHFLYAYEFENIAHKMLTTKGTKRTVVDLGTGDGRYVYKNAKQNKHSDFYGIDPTPKQFSTFKKKINRAKIQNAHLLKGSLENLPREILGKADELHINFPWGSLLKAVVLPSKEDLNYIDSIVKPGGTIEIILGYHKDSEPTQIDKLNLPKLSINLLEENIIKSLENINYKLLEIKTLGRSDLLFLESSWGKKLSFGKDRPVYKLLLKKNLV